VCNEGSGSRLGSYDMITYPGSRPSTPELKPLLPARRRVSWHFEDSRHGDGLMEGLDGVQRWFRLEIG
jgi:hypothetical protein